MARNTRMKIPISENEDSDKDERVVALLFYGPIEPVDKFLHPFRRFKWCGGLEDHT
jgi:hypothetical protein